MFLLAVSRACPANVPEEEFPAWTFPEPLFLTEPESVCGPGYGFRFPPDLRELPVLKVMSLRERFPLPERVSVGGTFVVPEER